MIISYALKNVKLKKVSHTNNLRQIIRKSWLLCRYYK